MRRAPHPTRSSGLQPMVGQSLGVLRNFGNGCTGPFSWCLAVLLLVAIVGSTARAQEARCLELGQNCDCSEPMDTTATSIRKGHDFADSPSGSECDKFQEFFGTNKSNITTTAETVMPAGNTVDRVLEIPSGGGSIVWLKGRMSVDDSIKRSCIRYYKMVSTDYSGVGPNNIGCPSERNKIIQFQFGNTQVQLQERADGSVCTGPGTGNDYQSITLTNPAGLGNFDLVPRADWEDCWNTNGWCRIEMCASGDLNRGKNIKFEAKITSLRDGVDHYSEQGRFWNPGSGMQAYTAGDLFHGQGQGGIGTEWISHFMQASWTTNQGEWIGAAYEIEGDGPPAGNPPLPPILLPE